MTEILEQDEHFGPKEGARIVGMWFAGNEAVDWMMLVWKNKDEDFHRGHYRFRYHVDDKVFDSDDRKHWYCMEFNKVDEDEIVMQVHLNAKEIAGHMGSPCDYVAIKSDDPMVMMEALKGKSWAHVKVMDKEEGES